MDPTRWALDPWYFQWAEIPIFQWPKMNGLYGYNPRSIFFFPVVTGSGVHLVCFPGGLPISPIEGFTRFRRYIEGSM